MRRRFIQRCLFVFAGAGLLTGHAGAASSETDLFPAKSVRMVVPLAPGGGSDIVARLVAQSLAQRWRQTVVVDNRPGAGGTIGNSIVARAAPDGYTMLVSSSTMAISSALYRDTGADIIRDFQPVTLIASQPSIIAVNAALPATSLQELIALMKARPGKLAFGSAGAGTASHLANVQFTVAAGVDALHVPYKSAGLAATALLSGELQFMVTNMATALPQLKAGRIKGLAVTSTRRVAGAPDLPTAGEAGLAGYDYTTWYAMLLPARTPNPVLSRIHADVVSGIQQRDYRERFAAQGLDVSGTSVDAFRQHLQAEVAKWRGVVQLAGLTAK